MIVVYPRSLVAGVQEPDLEEILPRTSSAAIRSSDCATSGPVKGRTRRRAAARAAAAEWTRGAAPRRTAKAMKEFAVNGTSVLVVHTGRISSRSRRCARTKAVPLEQGVHDAAS